MSDPAYKVFGPLDGALGGAETVAYVLLALVILNMITRIVAHRRIVKTAREEGADAISRHPIHAASNVLLLVVSFYYTSLDQHTGIVATSLVFGVVITDFFEFESRKVDARRDIGIELPKGSIAASLLALTYVGYLSLFEFVAPLWNAIV